MSDIITKAGFELKTINQKKGYSNGARADDSVNTINSDNRIKNRKIGPSHHFLEVLRKYQISEKI
jgi:hypothetical protein